MQQTNLKLYTHFRSSSSWRVRIVLNLKKLQYESIYINLRSGEHKSEDYAKVNPNQVVPTLVVDDNYLVESLAICHYLDEAYPQIIQLLPTDVIKRAQIRGFCEIINSAIQPYVTSRLYEWFEVTAPEIDRVSFVQPILHKGLTALDIILQKNHGQYSFGDQITLADVFLVPQVGSAVSKYQADLDKYPTLKLVYENLIKIPEFISALPENQKDFK